MSEHESIPGKMLSMKDWEENPDKEVPLASSMSEGESNRGKMLSMQDWKKDQEKKNSPVSSAELDAKKTEALNRVEEKLKSLEKQRVSMMQEIRGVEKLIEKGGTPGDFLLAFQSELGTLNTRIRRGSELFLRPETTVDQLQEYLNAS